jgi:hypothetical protein
MKKHKLAHLADIHLGRKFKGHPTHIGLALAEQRFLTLERAINALQEQECESLVIAGDLFDSQRVTKEEVARGLKILNQFDGPIALLPGNHDYHTPSSPLWDRIQRELEHLHAQEKFTLLLEDRPYHFAENITLYPFPCRNFDAPQASCQWVSQTPPAHRPAQHFHLGVAHGVVEGIQAKSSEGHYHSFNIREMERCQLDLWLFGHIHCPSIANDLVRFAYPGVLEADGMDAQKWGGPLIHHLGETMQGIRPSITTSLDLNSMTHFKFVQASLDLNSPGDFTAWSEKFLAQENSWSSFLLSLKLKGALNQAERLELRDHLEALKEKFFYVKINLEHLSERMELPELLNLYGEKSFPGLLLKYLGESEEVIFTETHDRNLTLNLARQLFEQCQDGENAKDPSGEKVEGRS